MNEVEGKDTERKDYEALPHATSYIFTTGSLLGPPVKPWDDKKHNYQLHALYHTPISKVN